MLRAAANLLVIDADSVERRRMAEYLRGAGHHVQEAEDAVSGLRDFHQFQPDVVLCDLRTPGSGGLDVLRAINADPAQTPVIVISAMGVMSDVVEALREGACDYLVKPVTDFAVLDHAIFRCLGQAQLRRDNRLYRERLEAANVELKNSLRLLEQDQQAGRLVQQKMLPATPRQFGDYEFSHCILPSFVLSGDLVDYFTVGDDHVVFFIADVSGHGASSAFVTVLLKNMFARKRSDFSHRSDNTILSPVGMLDVANRNLLNTDIGKHATLCVGVLDIRRHQLTYAVGGHLPLPVFAHQGASEYLHAEGMAVGLFEQAHFTESTLAIPPGATLTLFTDGILEVLPGSGVRAKERLLLESLNKGQRSIGAVLHSLEVSGKDNLPDDVAVLLVCRA